MPRSRPRAFSNEVTFGVSRYLAARDRYVAAFRTTSSRPRLEVVNKADSGPAELRIYEAIGGWFGITATDVAEALDDIAPDRDLVVRINSPGGDVFDGTAIYNLLRSRAGQVDVMVDGLAASAASFIAQAGDTITMNRGTQMMIHDAIGFTIGNAADHREQVALLDRISDEIAGIYAARAGSTVAEWRERMLATTWYSAAEAVEAGLADASSDDQVDADEDETEEDEELAARLRPAARVGNVATGANESADDPLAGIDGEVFASFGEVLDDVFDPTSGYDGDLVGVLIRDVYADAPAPPAVDPGPPRPRTTIPIGEFVDALAKGLQEGVRP
jgi:ATP-dependent protease ClpP protease subunit